MSAHDAFEHLRIKEYPRWTLYLHSNQYYLGSCYAWLKRTVEMHRLSDIFHEELVELHEIVLREYEEALERLWAPDHMNYAWLGNEFTAHAGHGHMHLIPRYARTPIFIGPANISYQFPDDRWGSNYAPRPVKIVPPKLLFAIRDTLILEMR